jgi:DNA-binding Lrp family transcriptional regulator
VAVLLAQWPWPVLCVLYSSSASRRGTLCSVIELDDVDRRILSILRRRPRTPVAEIARLAGVARGTAQARIDRLERTGAVTGYGPDVDAAAVGFGVSAFVTLEITQGQDHAVVDHLATVPEVLEVHAVTGPGDLLCRVVARSNAHLDEVIQAMLLAPGAGRTVTQLALPTRLRRAEVDLVSADDS